MKQEDKLKEAQRLYETANADQRYVLESLFPELKESEDERTRKEIVRFIQMEVEDEIVGNKWLAWLEKQKEFVSADCDDVWETADCDELTAPLEQYSKNAINKMCHFVDKNDMVEPKFKIGDWIITSENKVLQITSIEDTRYRFNDELRYWEIYYCDKECRLWTIEDAKDGDVLYAKGTKDSYFRDYIFNFSSFTEDNVISTNFGYNVFHGTFDTKLSRFGREEDFVSVTPTTKEQRDLLLIKMKEAGYEWNVDKKELKKLN